MNVCPKTNIEYKPFWIAFFELNANNWDFPVPAFPDTINILFLIRFFSICSNSKTISNSHNSCKMQISRSIFCFSSLDSLSFSSLTLLAT